MKKLLSILLIGGFLAACENSDNRDRDNTPSDSTTIQNHDSVSAIDTSTSHDRNTDSSR